MPWGSKSIMSLREEFVLKALTSETSFSELCSMYKISRKTGYKWLERYKEEGIIGLLNQSKRPLRSPGRTPNALEELILDTRTQFPAWGARKLRKYLENQGKVNLPSEPTFNRILKRNGRIDPNESKKRKHFIRFEKSNPNELWQMDFKGHFSMKDGRCHPLTIIDDHSRFSICLKACLSEDTASVKSGLIKAFENYGIPDAMTMDNGSPWKGSPHARFSKLTIWLMRLGIKVGHSRPYHPQTQGKDERFHRTLKEELLRFHQFKTLDEAQVYFDEWREVYNCLRPHEGINLLCPIDRYKPSKKVYVDKLPKIEYLDGDLVRKVERNGVISFKGECYYIGEHFQGEYVGLRAVNEKVWDVYYTTSKVKTIKLQDS